MKNIRVCRISTKNTCEEALEEEGSEIMVKLGSAAKRKADQAKATLDEAKMFKTKLEAALAGAKVSKTNLQEYLNSK